MVGQKMRCEANRNARALSRNIPSMINELCQNRGQSRFQFFSIWIGCSKRRNS